MNDALAEEGLRVFRLGPMEQMYVVSNLERLEHVQSFNFRPDMLLRPATGPESEWLSRFWSYCNGGQFGIPSFSPLEYRWDSANKCTQRRVESCYHILHIKQQPHGAYDLANASILTPKKIELAFHLLRWGERNVGGIGGKVARPDDNHVDLVSMVTLNCNEMHELNDLAEKLRNYSCARINLTEALGRYNALDFIPWRSPLRFLGYFSIVEMLLTRRKLDQGEKTTWQVVRKLKVVERRSRLKIPFSILQPTGTDEAKLKKVYEYRNCVAHGDVPDFVNELQWLKDHETATRFAERCASMVMREVLERPEEVADIRDS